ncbi:hypothetical protein [Paraconexibacter algicola]|uniref:Uncharacterized protein n=1 Tax=Paraconexibacter algicola TaxID=2133960 RepID=A0A2T4UHC0_9ACTN|nr:hypothetical protein [Paraconexibacter algicola]PTL58595.1 hypothetical protein C7Y72_02440 [Paraconexibacter algicola]
MTSSLPATPARLARRAVLVDAAMLASQTVDMRASGRAPSTGPADVASRLLGVEIPGQLRGPVTHAMQLSLTATAVVLDEVLGTSRPAVARAAGIAVTLVAVDAALFALVGGAASPVRWSRADVARELVHKTVVGVATVATSSAR